MSNTPTGPPARRGERPAYDRDSLLEVAVAVFNERGYDGTGMEDLARRLGLSKSCIYHHVTGKQELLSLAVTRALDSLFAVLDEELPADTSATARLRHVVRRSVEVLASELPYVTPRCGSTATATPSGMPSRGGASSTTGSPAWSSAPRPRGAYATTSVPTWQVVCCSAP